MNNYISAINGHLDIKVSQNEDEIDGELYHWNEVLIHGDPEGLRSLANLLLKLADVNQEAIISLPEGAREHIRLRPENELSNSSDVVIIGRLDAKCTGNYYEGYIPKK